MNKVTSEKMASDARHPPYHAASGTATAADTADPVWMPVVYTPGWTRWPGSKTLLDSNRHDSTGKAHADADRPGEENNERRARRDSPCETKDANEQNRKRDCSPGTNPCAEIRSRRCEETHAQDRNCREQSCNGMRRIQAVLDLGEKRTDTDDRGA